MENDNNKSKKTYKMLSTLPNLCHLSLFFKSNHSLLEKYYKTVLYKEAEKLSILPKFMDGICTRTGTQNHPSCIWLTESCFIPLHYENIARHKSDNQITKYEYFLFFYKGERFLIEKKTKEPERSPSCH